MGACCTGQASQDWATQAAKNCREMLCRGTDTGAIRISARTQDWKRRRPKLQPGARARGGRVAKQACKVKRKRGWVAPLPGAAHTWEAKQKGKARRGGTGGDARAHTAQSIAGHLLRKGGRAIGWMDVMGLGHVVADAPIKYLRPSNGKVCSCGERRRAGRGRRTVGEQPAPGAPSESPTRAARCPAGRGEGGHASSSSTAGCAWQHLAARGSAW
jgi:hypothetical protein